MKRSADDRGAVLVITLAVVTALGLVCAGLLEGTRSFLRRERVAWSAVVALADAQSGETWWVGHLERQPQLTCSQLMARSPPELANGGELSLSCAGGPPQPWSVTVSATHDARRAVISLILSVGVDGSVQVQERVLVTGPNPAFTNAA